MKPLILALIILSPAYLFAQVGVNETGAPPHAGAILDVVSSTKGVLLPRTQASQITNPTTGMVIYDTDTQGFRYYNGMQWMTLLEEGAYSFWWADQDGDGYGYPFNVIYAPTAPEFYVGNNDDCDDQNNLIGPASAEVCDGIDNNCDGQIDEGNPGGGAPCGSSVGECQQGILTCVDGVLICQGEVGPQPEVCDGLDNNCNGDIDESPVDGTSYWPDVDDDGYGDMDAVPLIACTAPIGYVTNGEDCDDGNSSIHPLAVEVCDGVDNDCDGVIDDGNSCDDGNPCTTDICVDGVCQNNPVPSGTPCPGGLCDGTGTCILD